jgi:dTDP-4-amino-4,6-dideoxygalactose transaminase/broad specificity phosphatase PhoE
MKLSSFELVLVRHAEARYELNKEYPPTDPVHLTTRGHAQARRLASELKARWDIKYLYSSGLGPAVQTALPIGCEIGLPVCVDPAFDELAPFTTSQNLRQARFLAECADSGMRNLLWPSFTPGLSIGGELERLTAAIDATLSVAGLERQGTMYKASAPAEKGAIVIVGHSGTMHIGLSRLLDLSPVHVLHAFVDNFCFIANVGFIEFGEMRYPCLKSFGPLLANHAGAREHPLAGADVSCQGTDLRSVDLALSVSLETSTNEGPAPTTITPIVEASDLARVWPQADIEEAMGLERVLQSSAWCRLGDSDWRSGECGLFEQELGAYLGAEHVLAVSNGTLAIELALQALGVSSGDEVLVQAGTFFGSVTPILKLKAVPVFVDLAPDTLTVDPDSLAERRTERTVGVIVVPLCGLAPDMDRIAAFCSKYGLWMVEDCAQAFGSSWRGKSLGTIGHIGTFSFQQHKVLQAGEGGAVVCGDEQLLGKVYAGHLGFSMPGAPHFERHVPGTNGRLTSWQAAVLRCQLRRIDTQLATRLANHRRLCEQLTPDDPITPVMRLPGADRWGLYSAPMLFDSEKAGGMSRDEFIEALSLRGVPATPGHIEPLYWRPLFRDNPSLPSKYRDCPVTEKVTRESYLTLMNWFFLGQSRWIDALVDWVRTVR